MQAPAQAILGALKTEEPDHERVDGAPNGVFERVILTPRNRVDSAVHAPAIKDTMCRRLCFGITASHTLPASLPTLQILVYDSKLASHESELYPIRPAPKCYASDDEDTQKAHVRGAYDEIVQQQIGVFAPSQRACQRSRPPPPVVFRSVLMRCTDIRLRQLELRASNARAHDTNDLMSI